MITGFASLTGRLLLALTFVFTVTACGGGGGGGGSFVPDQNEGEVFFLDVTLLDENGNPTDAIATSAPTNVQVRVTRNGPNGRAVANVVVTLQTDLGTITPASGSSLTDANGIADFSIEVDPSTGGAGTLLAGADSETGSFTGEFNFQVGVSGRRLGYIDEGGTFIENEIDIEPDALLASQAIAQLSLVVLDENNEFDSEPQTISIDSGCLSSGQSTLEPPSPILIGDGRLVASYIAGGCVGNDQITASLVGSPAQAFGTVSIASAAANSLSFVSAVPTTIVLRGTGGGADRFESSTVTFMVVDRNNSPLSGAQVSFDLTTNVGGLSLSPTTAISDSAGMVSTSVVSGDIPTVVRVIASSASGDTSGQEVSTVSDILTVSTGLPDQNSISLGVEDGAGFIVEDGFTVNGVQRTLTVSMADTFNNPVPDGTAAVFTTEYGSIDPSCQTGLANGERLTGTPAPGECSVLWTSGAPRVPTLTGTAFLQTIFSADYNCPSLNVGSGPCPDDLGFTRGGRLTILVTGVGNESFVDRNGNGIMDENEQFLFENLSEAWRDDNEDGLYNPATAECQGAGFDSPQCIAGQEEIFTDFNDNGRFDLNDDPPIFNGLQCPPEGDGIWCSRQLINVRSSTVLTLSNPSEWYFSVFSASGSFVDPITGSVQFNGGPYTIYISDIFNNPPPAGSTISLSAVAPCEIVSPTETIEVGILGGPGALRVPNINTGGTALEPNATGLLEVTFTAPDGNPVTEVYTCVPSPFIPPPDPNDPGNSLGTGGTGP
ncbi:MAG: hypothetical protein AAGF57_10735 [Pseudomonadota bacterium]